MPIWRGYIGIVEPLIEDNPMLHIQQVDFPLAISGHAPAHNTQADYLIGKYVASVRSSGGVFTGFVGDTMEEVQAAFDRELCDWCHDNGRRVMQPHMVRKHVYSPLGEKFEPLPA
jgi:hypothetical protein